jgi:transcriptional regulator of nitric oxide reductase
MQFAPFHSLRRLRHACLPPWRSGCLPSAAPCRHLRSQAAARAVTSPRMCDYAPCKDVIPGATAFSERKGQPWYVEAYKDEAGQKSSSAT